MLGSVPANTVFDLFMQFQIFLMFVLIGGCPRPGHRPGLAGASRDCQNKWKSSDGWGPIVDGRGWPGLAGAGKIGGKVLEMPRPVAPATGRGAGTSFSLFGKFSNFDHTGREQLIQIPYSFCLKEYVSFLPLRDMLN